ncbi:heparan-alpha-glucosaminide N-acetyltransferase-like [Diabrotica undecimpunctata]|uniref:heparan-alpha-glucosaminide N-acetyltransferase-like n=1 Tax=Diabrotica undecimpunctata TaxID=50387 RepID=UPI003B63FE42
MKWCFIDDYDVSDYRGYSLANLTLDQYYLNIEVAEDIDKNVYLYTLNKECYQCPYLITNYCKGSAKECDNDLTKNIFSTDVTFRLATERTEYLPQDQTENVICDIKEELEEFGVYNVDVNNSGCFLETLKEPVNIYAPILTIILIYVAIFILIYASCRLWKKIVAKKTVDRTNTEINSSATPKKERISSLDAYRGLTILFMIFANYGQGGYTVIEHARWNGLHAADLVFPSFLWIMGACIPIGMVSNFKKNISNRDMIWTITKRSLKLFCLGLFLNGGSDINYLRIFGVLQRLGIGYFVAAVSLVYLMQRKQNDENEEGSWWKYFKDLKRIYKAWLLALAVLILHTILIFAVAAPGCPRGYMGPGGLHKNSSYKHCVGGATGYIDGLILGNHRYQHPTIYKTYESKPFDPEGVVGCLTTIFHIFLGVQGGMILISYKSHSQRLLRWLFWAVIPGMIGGALCGFSKEDGFIPVNKNLWSLSFVLVTTCFSFFMLSLFYLLVDAKKWWSGKPFTFVGQNAILLYIGHEMCDGHFPIRWYLHNYSSLTNEERRTHFLALLSDTWGTGMWGLVAYYLYKIKYFFTI